MKYFRLFLYFIVMPCFLPAQNPMQPVLKSYFRTHPFDMHFSSFITSLQEDPWFTIENYNRRTDSTFFFLTGTYKNFNPFRYQAKEVRLTIAEESFIHADSAKTLDTIINIQLMGITDSGSLHQTEVSKEYTRFIKKYGTQFNYMNHYKGEPGTKINWELSNLFIFPFSISPVTIGWGQTPDDIHYTFTINIRCKVKQNIADLILTPEGL